MCYPFPGPRCSYHAHKEYLQAQQQLAKALTVEEQTVADRVFQTKQENYDATPKGLNSLRRDIDSLPESDEREALIARRETGAAQRAQQLSAYKISKQTKTSEIKNVLSERGLNGRYEKACGIALDSLQKMHPDKTFEILNLNTVFSETQQKEDDKKILVLPHKTQIDLGIVKQKGFTLASENMSDLQIRLVNAIFVEESPDVLNKLNIQFLASFGYTHYIVVNLVSEATVVKKINELTVDHKINCSFRRKQSGSKSVFLPKKETKKLLSQREELKDGTLVFLEKSRKTLLEGVPKLSSKNVPISENFFASWREDVSLYEIRKHVPQDKFNVILKIEKL